MKQPMERVDRLFKPRSYLGALDQRNELELTTTKESSTPRLNRALSAQMYYILVIMKTLDRCRNASVSEEFAGRRQFVREWEPRFVGLLRNVLSCRRKDDIPTQLPENVIDDIMMVVNVLRMENGRVEACLTMESTNCELYTGAKGEPRDYENTTVNRPGHVRRTQMWRSWRKTVDCIGCQDRQRKARMEHR